MWLVAAEMMIDQSSSSSAENQLLADFAPTPAKLPATSPSAATEAVAAAAVLGGQYRLLKAR